ncbi:uncharacterized protein LOC141685516 [Apium graveolens]|uniref:uncharacterized protein LOC141685516 n=1 Tax=Apium graveolens TaxID=4045 RepID=UPI003D7A520D
MTDQPLKRILHKPDMTGRLAAWTVELSQFHIEYLPRSAMKSQILSDFVVEWLRLAIELEVKVLEIFGDYQLVAKQLQGEFKAHDARMSIYLNLARSMLKKISSWTIKNIYMEDNQLANALSKLASSFVTTSEHQPILEYILLNKLPQDMGEARAISYKAKNYCVLENKLYRRGLVEPLLRCLGPEESHTSIVEVHTGICGDHLGGKNLALKIVRHGLFGP